MKHDQNLDFLCTPKSKCTEKLRDKMKDETSFRQLNRDLNPDSERRLV